MSNLAYSDVIPTSSFLYKYRNDKEAIYVPNQKENKITIIHTIPKMTDIEREKNEKLIANDLYEIFSRIQQQLALKVNC